MYFTILLPYFHRKEVRERERLTKQLVLEQSLIAEEPPTAGEDRDRAVMEAERFVESERQRVATRMELVRQLEEAEVKETKENVKLLHQCFQNWWGQVRRKQLAGTEGGIGGRQPCPQTQKAGEEGEETSEEQLAGMER